MKKELKNIAIRVFNYPALFIHELLHIVACLLTLTPITGVKIGFTSLRGYVKYGNPETKLINYIINLAPCLSFIVSAILIFVASQVFVFLFIYFVLSPSSYLSDEDIKNIKNFGIEKTDEDDLNEYISRYGSE